MQMPAIAEMRFWISSRAVDAGVAACGRAAAILMLVGLLVRLLLRLLLRLVAAAIDSVAAGGHRLAVSSRIVAVGDSLC